MSEYSNTSRFNLGGNVYGAINTGGIAGNINNEIVSGEKQTLAEAATEIQALLRLLEQTNPVYTDTEKAAYINDETTPKFKRRVAQALQTSGEAAIEELFDDMYVNFVKRVIKSWMKPE